MRIIELLQDHIYSTLFTYVLIEEFGVPMPIPGDAILLILGVRSSQLGVNLLLLLLLTCIGTLIGASLLFFIARKVGRPFLLKHEKYLKYIHITQPDVDNIEHYMQQHGAWVLVIARITPGLRTMGTITAGLLNVSYKKFISATLLGTVLWTLLYYQLGVFLGRRYEAQIEEIFKNKLLLLVVFILGLGVWVIIFKYLIPALRHHPHRDQVKPTIK